MGCSGFPVTVRRRDVVAAALPVQEHRLPMSNLDLLLPPLDFGIFFCYPNTKNRETSNENNIVAGLKKALSEALVSFYPLSGEIVQNGHGEPEILCNNRGVDFTHAYADVELKRIDLYRPDLSVHAKLLPLKMHGVLSVQVTELKCGGLFIGCTFDHRAADAHSANMFLTAWAHIAQSNPTTPLLPSFRRSLFSPRRPPQPHTSLDKHYAPLLPPTAADQDHLVSRIYYVRSSEIDRLQSQSSCNGTKRTKIESFSAFLWKTMSTAAGDPSRKKMRLGVVVDGRTRLGGEASSLGCYFGNVLSVPHVEASAGDLRTTPLERVAEIVHGCIATASTAEHFLGLVDWVELRRPKPAVVKVYCRDEDDEAAVVVSSGLGFPVRDLDFGWGGPVFGSYHFAWGGETGYVMPMRSASGDAGDWIVFMHLMRRHLDLLEARAPHVFCPLISSHYLDL